MKSYIQKQLGERIKKLRKAKGLSQEAFAEKIGIATNTLSSIETGNAFMTAQTLENIIELIGISPQELFTFKERIKKEDMYKYVTDKLKLIKNNEEYLTLVYNVIKSLC